MSRGNVLLVASVAFSVHSAVLAPLVGMVGWSRAVSVGLHTLVSDHLGALAVAAAATMLATLVAALRMRPVPVARVLAVLASMELLAALAPIAAIGELTLVHVPLVVAAISGLGLVFVSTAIALIAADRIARRT